MTGWHTRLWVVFKKEVRDHTRDRRSLILALLYPLLGPLLVAGGLMMGGKTLNVEDRQSVTDIPTVGIEFAPDLVRYFVDHHLRMVAAPKTEHEQIAAVRDGRLPLVLIIPKTAQGSEDFTVKVIANLARIQNLRPTARLTQGIWGYNETIAKVRAVNAGLTEGYASPVKQNKINVARDSNIALFFYNMMPPLIIFMIFLGGVHLAIDTTVGERERGSLEPLLLAPVERWVLLLSKSGAAFAFTVLTTVANLSAFKVFMGFAASSSPLLVPPPDVWVFLIILAVSLPLMAIAVALQMSISVITRSMKEAQIYLGLLPLIPALPGMVMVFKPLTPTDITASIPVFGQMLLLGQLVSGEDIDPVHIALATTTTLLAAAAIFLVAARWFRREKMFVLG